MLKRRLIGFLIVAVIGFTVFYFARSCFGPKDLPKTPPKASYAVTYHGRVDYGESVVMNDGTLTLAKPWVVAKGEWVPGPRPVIRSLRVSDNITITRLK